MAQQYTVKVLEKIYETSDTITIKFKQPALKKIRYKSGQYITLIARINGRTYRRPYSLSSVFGLDTTLNITVKAIHDGIVSNYLLQAANVGDAFEIVEPIGNFVIPENLQDETIFLWSAGSGITPAWSIMRDILYNKDRVRIVLVYCNRNKSTIIFGNNLQKLQESFPERLFVYHKLSKPEKYDDDYFFEGRISQHSIHKLLQHYPSLNNTLHYVCGPAEMMDLIGFELSGHVTPEKIYQENFHNIIDEKDLIGVKNAEVNLEYNAQNYLFSVPVGKTILDACLDQFIDFPYSCQTGSCTFCKAALLKGGVKMVTHQTPEQELLENEYLLCCSFPTENELTFKA